MKALRIVAVSLFALAAARAAQASPISFTDTFNPADVFMDGQVTTECTGTNDPLDLADASATPCEVLNWTHALTGFLPGDNLTSGTLTITAYNDPSTNNQSFDLIIDVLPAITDLTVTDASTVGSPGTFSFPFATYLVGKLGDGVLNLTLTSANGNHTFYFAKSVLEVAGTRGETGVNELDAVAAPEPASLMLLGTGLIFAGSRLRSKRSKVGRTV